MVVGGARAAHVVVGVDADLLGVVVGLGFGTGCATGDVTVGIGVLTVRDWLKLVTVLQVGPSPDSTEDYVRQGFA